VRYVLINQLDGSLPNLALLRIAAHHAAAGDCVEYRNPRRPEAVTRGLFDAPYSRVYAGLIFEKTRPLAKRLREVYPNAIVGGTGWDYSTTLASAGIPEDIAPDYSNHPGYPHSIGFTQRGCRLKCSFCVVPKKEGGINSAGSVWNVYRGEPHPRNLVLLDNDFFGSPEWAERIKEIRDGRFRVSFCQGINARFLTDETAAAIASVDYFDADFRKRRLYTAWDNRRDEDRLFAGLDCLKRAGVPPSRVMVYVLVGYDHATKSGRGVITEDDVYRIRQLRAWGADPYPMPFVRTRETIGFQRWVCRFVEKKGVPWAEYKHAGFDSRN
jgi:pyruvate-formate lyase-activating enzyme